MELEWSSALVSETHGTLAAHLARLRAAPPARPARPPPGERGGEVESSSSSSTGFQRYCGSEFSEAWFEVFAADEESTEEPPGELGGRRSVGELPEGSAPGEGKAKCEAKNMRE